MSRVTIEESYGHDPFSQIDVIYEDGRTRVRARERTGKASVFLNRAEVQRLIDALLATQGLP